MRVHDKVYNIKERKEQMAATQARAYYHNLRVAANLWPLILLTILLPSARTNQASDKMHTFFSIFCKVFVIFPFWYTQTIVFVVCWKITAKIA